MKKEKTIHLSFFSINFVLRFVIQGKLFENKRVMYVNEEVRHTATWGRTIEDCRFR